MESGGMTWKSSYTKALNVRAEYLHQLGAVEIAQALENKAQAFQEVCVSSSKLKSSVATTTLPEILARQPEEVFARIERFAHLIPLSQQEEYRERLSVADLSTEDLNEIREELLERIWKSYRATHHAKELIQRPSYEKAMGPYNNRTVLEDFLENVSECDPIWVADFTELYQRMRIWEKLLKNA